MLVLWTGDDGKNAIDLYDINGQFIRRFGKGIMKISAGIAADNELRILVLDSSGVHAFSEEGNQLSTFQFKKKKRIFTSHHSVPPEKRAFIHVLLK